MFDLSIRHKAGKANVVPDALSRLQGRSTEIDKDGPGILEALYGRVLQSQGSQDDSPERSSAHVQNRAPIPDRSDAPVCFHVTLIEMSQDFKTRLVLEYTKDEQ